MNRIDEITNDIVDVLGDADVAWKRRTVDQIATAIIECERLEREMLEILTSEGYEAAAGRYMEIREEFDGKHVYDFRETVLNDAGYGVMRFGMTDLALDVFRLNTVGHPDAFNTWDSLAEAYMNKGDAGNAVKYYERSLEINPQNTNAVQMLKRVRQRTDDK